MKKLLLTVLNTFLLTFFLNFIAQPLRADNQKIDDLLQERSEILEEALRVAHLRFKSGEDEGLQVISEVQVEIMEAKLEKADRLEIGKRQEKRFEILELAIAETSEAETFAKIGERAGFVTRLDVLLAESLRLEMQIQLEQEKLFNGFESQSIDSLLKARSEILKEALRLARFRYTVRAKNMNINITNEVLVEFIETRLTIADRSEVRKRQEKRVEILKSAVAEASETERNVSEIESKFNDRNIKFYSGEGQVSPLDFLLAESWRLEMQIQLEKEKLSHGLE